MGDRAGEDDLGVIQWTDDCKFIHFLPNEGARDSNVFCSMSADNLNTEFQGLVRDANSWVSCGMHLMLADGVGVN